MKCYLTQDPSQQERKWVSYWGPRDWKPGLVPSLMFWLLGELGQIIFLNLSLLMHVMDPAHGGFVSLNEITHINCSEWCLPPCNCSSQLIVSATERKGWKPLLKQESGVSEAMSIVRNSLSVPGIVLFLAWESLSKCHFLIGFGFIIRTSRTVAEAEKPWIKLCLI